MDPTQCDTCWYYDYDEELDEYVCIQDFDEDEMYRLLSSGHGCPYYRAGDDYTLARRQ